MSKQKKVTFKWPHGGTEVLLVGTFTKWQEGAVKMKREEKDGPFVTRVRLSPGTYQFKFIVDGNWNFDHSQFYVMDGSGNTNNELTVHTDSKDDPEMGMPGSTPHTKKTRHSIGGNHNRSHRDKNSSESDDKSNGTRADTDKSTGTVKSIVKRFQPRSSHKPEAAQSWTWKVDLYNVVTNMDKVDRSQLKPMSKGALRLQTDKRNRPVVDYAPDEKHDKTRPNEILASVDLSETSKDDDRTWIWRMSKGKMLAVRFPSSEERNEFLVMAEDMKQHATK